LSIISTLLLNIEQKPIFETTETRLDILFFFYAFTDVSWLDYCDEDEQDPDDNSPPNWRKAFTDEEWKDLTSSLEKRRTTWFLSFCLF
jgi:hypothetical protein